ncbi:MAG: hypothetical protein OXS30_09055 [Chloroflexota bacterium]|nr:hypothetical protein [Chloroflexota bacterium]MDE2894344.1 hypothetical protein [Chloroflexota bacterium]MDE2967612.1 hypothetical protein [Chloroflexota bacterium]
MTFPGDGRSSSRPAPPVSARGGGGLAGDAIVSFIIVLGGSVIGGLVAHFGNRIRLAEARQPDSDG